VGIEFVNRVIEKSIRPKAYLPLRSQNDRYEGSKLPQRLLRDSSPK
jgi:hypothetical protein